MSRSNCWGRRRASSGSAGHFDEAVFGHLRAGVNMPPLDPSDPDVLAAVARVRRECTEAKEALSSDTEVAIPVLLPQLQARVRMVRSEFESMVRDAVEDTVDALRRAVESAGLSEKDVDSVLLVGGSSRIPLVAQLVSAEFGRPIAVDADPKASIALGAARVAAAIALGAARVAAARVAAPVAQSGGDYTASTGSNGARLGAVNGWVHGSSAGSPAEFADHDEEATQPNPVVHLPVGLAGDAATVRPRRRRIRRIPAAAVIVLIAIAVTAGRLLIG